MTTKLLAVLVLAGGSLYAETHFSFGINFGGPGYYAPPPPVVTYVPPPEPVVTYAPPPCPGPEYTWVSGYWYPVGPRYAWRGGYWSRAPYPGAYWVTPRYDGSRYYSGYWGHRERGDRDDDDRWERREWRGNRGWHR